jgi:hypothetical protein
MGTFMWVEDISTKLRLFHKRKGTKSIHRLRRFGRFFICLLRNLLNLWISLTKEGKPCPVCLQNSFKLVGFLLSREQIEVVY